MNEIKFQKGDTYEPCTVSREAWVAGIHADDHGNAIEVYGFTKEAAEDLRDKVLSCLRSQAGVVPAGWMASISGLVDDIDGLLEESIGVYGLHKNGDVSPWNEITPGGRFERLTHLNDVRALLSAAPSAPVAADENAESNFNQLMYINNWLIGRGLLSLERSEEKDGPLAPAKNITDSIQRLMAADERVRELEDIAQQVASNEGHHQVCSSNQLFGVCDCGHNAALAALAARKADGKGGVA